MQDKSDWNGLPENPERDGWHWVVTNSGPQVSLWLTYGERWLIAGHGIGTQAGRAVFNGWRYLGPCLTPAEVEERERAAAKEMRERAAREIEWHGNVWQGKPVPVDEAAKCLAAAIRALPLTEGEG